MARLAVIKFADNRPTGERSIPLEFVPISTDLKEEYATLSQLVWDYMSTIGSPPIREINRLLKHWLLTKANLHPHASDQQDLERILNLITFLSELYTQSKLLEWHEEENSTAVDYVNNQPDIKEVSCA